jgi:aspartyl-tRNA(Asn)/glutamyl-tRNA(Gln) amidotransferase subunit C
MDAGLSGDLCPHGEIDSRRNRPDTSGDAREWRWGCARISGIAAAGIGGENVKISREDVVRVAELAYLELSEAELEMYRAQIDEILEYIGKLNELDTSCVEPMAQVLADDQTADATLREDVVVACDVGAEVLRGAPDAEGIYFRVPKVIER